MIKPTPAQRLARDADRLNVLASKLSGLRRLMEDAELGSDAYAGLAAMHRNVEAEFADLERRHVAAGGQPWRPE